MLFSKSSKYTVVVLNYQKETKMAIQNKSPICMILLLMVMFIGKIEDNITVKSIDSLRPIFKYVRDYNQSKGHCRDAACKRFR